MSTAAHKQVRGGAAVWPSHQGREIIITAIVYEPQRYKY